MPAGRPPKYETPEEMQRLIDLYFIACRNNANPDPELLDGLSEKDLQVTNWIDDVCPTVSGLAYTLDMTTETLRTYGEDDRFSATVKRAKQRVEKFLEQRLQGGTAAGTIFNLKNNFGWKDKTESELSGPGGGSIKTDNKLTI